MFLSLTFRDFNLLLVLIQPYWDDTILDHPRLPVCAQHYRRRFRTGANMTETTYVYRNVIYLYLAKA